MEAFVRVIDAGSFSGAAKQLRIGQPAISKTIAQLEERLGACLLLRSTQGLTPTEAGWNFYERAKRSIEEAEQAEQAARGAAATLSGRLRISAAPTFARLYVIPRLPLFLAEHPRLEIDIILDDRPIDLIEAGVDVALRVGQLTDSALTARKIAQRPRSVIGSPAYFDAAGVPRTPADLAMHQAVIYEQRGGGAAWTFMRANSEVAVTLHGRIRVTAAEGVREIVFAGLALTVSPEWIFGPELETGAVRTVLQDWSLPAVPVWAVFPTGRRASVKARAFASFVESQLSNGRNLASAPHAGRSASPSRSPPMTSELKTN